MTKHSNGGPRSSDNLTYEDFLAAVAELESMPHQDFPVVLIVSPAAYRKWEEYGLIDPEDGRWIASEWVEDDSN